MGGVRRGGGGRELGGGEVGSWEGGGVGVEELRELGGGGW